MFFWGIKVACSSYPESLLFFLNLQNGCVGRSLMLVLEGLQYVLITIPKVWIHQYKNSYFPVDTENWFSIIGSLCFSEERAYPGSPNAFTNPYRYGHPLKPFLLSLENFTRGDWALLAGSTGTFLVIFLLSRTQVRLGTHYDFFSNSLMNRDKRGLFQIARLIGVATLASKVIGLAREAALAAVFGVGPVINAFNYASIVPGFFLTMLGGINGPFHTAMTAALSKRQKEEGQHLVASISLLAGLFCTGLSLLIFLYAAQLINALAPGLSVAADGVLTQQIAVLQVPYSYQKVSWCLIYTVHDKRYPTNTMMLWLNFQNIGVLIVTSLGDDICIIVLYEQLDDMYKPAKIQQRIKICSTRLTVIIPVFLWQCSSAESYGSMLFGFSSFLALANRFVTSLLYLIGTKWMCWNKLLNLRVWSAKYVVHNSKVWGHH